MMKKFSMTTLIVFCLIFFLSVFPAEAVGQKSGGKSGGSEKAEEAQSNPNKGSTRSCIAREAGVEKQLTQLFELVTKMENIFDKAAGKLETFYITKLLPEGKTVPNYDALVKDIADKKTLTQTTKGKTQSDIDAFDCSTGDPKVLKSGFRSNMQSVKTALKNYRTAVLNLAQAIREVAVESDTINSENE